MTDPIYYQLLSVMTAEIDKVFGGDFKAFFDHYMNPEDEVLEIVFSFGQGSPERIKRIDAVTLSAEVETFRIRQRYFEAEIKSTT